MVRFVSMDRQALPDLQTPAAIVQTARAPIQRGERARARVLRAALEILADEGLPGLTMEAVASRAGASKATLYRRWPSRAALLVDAMGASFEPSVPPGSGDLRSDLVSLIRVGEGLFDRPLFARLMAAVIDAGEREPALVSLHRDLTDRRRRPVLVVLAAAERRGQIAPGTDLELVTDLLVGPFFYRRFVSHRPFPEHFAEAVVDAVLRGFRAR